MLNRIVLAAATTVLAAGAWGQEAPADRKQLDGIWLPTSAELGEQPFPDKILKTMKLMVDGGKYTVTIGDIIDKGTVKTDPSKKPKTMDLLGTEGPNKDKSILAIYEVNGDTLRVCYDLTGKSHPAEFKTKKGEQRFLAVYRRKVD